MNSSSLRGHRSKIHPSDLKEATEATHSSSSNKVNTKEKKASGLSEEGLQGFQNLQMSSKPLQVKDKVFYWQEDKSKIRSDGSKGGIWLKGKVISIEGAMVGLDLGTRLIKVNMTKLRKDETIPPGNPELTFCYLKSENPCRRSNQEKESSAPAPKPRSSVPLRIAGKTTQNLQYLIQQRTCSSRTSHPFLNKHIGIVYVRERSTLSRSLQEVPDSVNAVHYQVLRLGLSWTSAQDSM